MTTTVRLSEFPDLSSNRLLPFIGSPVVLDIIDPEEDASATVAGVLELVTIIDGGVVLLVRGNDGPLGFGADELEHVNVTIMGSNL